MHIYIYIYMHIPYYTPSKQFRTTFSQKSHPRIIYLTLHCLLFNKKVLYRQGFSFLIKGNAM